MKFSIYTLGCKVNQYESSVISSAFEAEGYEVVPPDAAADVCCINTCAVTEESARKSRQIIRRMRTLNPGAVIIAVGCMTQTSPEAVGISEADIIIGTTEKTSLPEYVSRFLRDRVRICEIKDVSNERKFEKMTADRSERTRATVKIQDGCNNFCSYCIIPYARGRIRSKDEKEALEEIASLISEGGYKEVVLTGIHLDNYGLDTKTTDLCTLLEKADNIPGVERIRLGSLEPVFITDGNVARLAKLKHLCPQFHLSLQSGCDSTLRRMNRHYTAADYLRAVEILRRYIPDVAVTTDIIVGFPGETSEEFAESKAFAEKVGFLKIHVFPFSERKGTAAANMDGKIDKAVKAERVAELSAVSQNSAKAFMSRYVGRTVPVLFERERNGWCGGFTPNYIDVRVVGALGLTNTVRDVQITEIFEDFAVGVLK
ncbi:MAG: tRNA (N(6)-L-threonylcarbamoyladenosine(37)-C(2))-methylthiotransferase MtaB [Eubacteriales bacterium]